MFFTLLQDLQMMMHYSFPFLLPIWPPFFFFCHILVSQSQNLVSEYGSSFAVQSSASNGLLNSQSGSEWSKLLVDPFKHCCFSSSHTSQHQVSFAPALLVSAHLHWQYKQHSTFLLTGLFVPLTYHIHISFSPIRSKDMQSLFIQCHTSLTCRYIAFVCLHVVITSVSSFFWSSRCCHSIAFLYSQKISGIHLAGCGYLRKVWNGTKWCEQASWEW